ncbi:nucleotidyltransferase domain-containing protein [Mucilaginibacter sp. dw_454]|uniref:nucleotidyltransferase family protein n=1 Tax=Mucilaginibacter sp. dw_454 TaxID=2720079 RepID=UPI001BD356F6|nr:nucleotidyltransferase domain-containing protein [Mucilaginibacter sp. dw_454]
MNRADLYSKNFIAICKSHKVKELYIFGSAVNGNFTDKSDLDVLVEINEPDPLIRGELLLSLWNELELYSNRKVDLLTSSSLRNPYLLESINNTKRLLYDGSKEEVLR